jgi:hypothetical protein
MEKIGNIGYIREDGMYFLNKCLRWKDPYPDNNIDKQCAKCIRKNFSLPDKKPT